MRLLTGTVTVNNDDYSYTQTDRQLPFFGQCNERTHPQEEGQSHVFYKMAFINKLI